MKILIAVPDTGVGGVTAAEKFIGHCKAIEHGEDYRSLYESGPCSAVK